MYGLDLFSGIGGITKALEGYVQPVAYCENDRYAQAVLLSRMASGDLPTAPIWDNVLTLDGKSIEAQIDIIYGGFPCQDISCAGRGEGLDGKRSGLFFEIIRLVREIRPRFVFLENVSAITVRGAERVIGEFCRLRYDCRWGILSASDVGANHERKRWWLLAHSPILECNPRPEEQGAIREVHGNWAERNNAGGSGEALAHTRLFGQTERQEQTTRVKQHGQEVADTPSPISSRLSVGTESAHAKSGQSGWWATEPNVGRVANGIPFRVDRLRALGNSVVPAQAREAFERLMGLKC